MGREHAVHPTAALQNTVQAPVRPAGTGTPVTAPAGPLAPGTVLQFQRTAGNAAVAGMVAREQQEQGPGQGHRRTPPTGVHVQRAGGRTPAEGSDGKRPSEPSGRAVDGPAAALDVTANSSGMAGGATVAGQYDVPTFSTDASYALGVGAPFASTLTAGYGAVSSASAARTAHREREAAPSGSGERRAANSEYRGAAADTAQHASNFVGQALTGTGGAMNLAGQNVALYNSVLAPGAGAALPAGAIQAGRYLRKGLHAHQRAHELKELIKREEIEPLEALVAAQEQVVVQRMLLAKLHEDLADWKRQAAALREQLEQDPSYGSTGNAADLPPERQLLSRQLFDIEIVGLPEIKEHIASAEQGLTRALADQERREAYKKAMETALRELAGEVQVTFGDKRRPISLRTIQLYALYKNQRGRRNKLVQAVSGAAGASGSVATLVSAAAVGAGATAGAGVLAATPVGWALAGAAAATGLGLASKDAWHYFAKRWEQTAENHPEGHDDHTLEHLGETLAFWRRTGPNQREEYARVLYEFSTDAPVPERVTEARNTLTALGLDWDGLPTDPQAAIKEIARKMASK
ncbi:hypothetical protein [Streptomyces sp. NPDC059142]|uniref:hypothetical protein n=1 Tax=Streptomyces sp. NPDC059142 TaxID=3346739 RepID=UPI0036A30BAD